MIHSVQCVANLFLLFLSRPEGQIISVPHYNIQIPLPSKGEVVTFSYEVSTRRELPVNPVITKIRGDITWEDVLLSHLTELKLQNTGTLLWILLILWRVCVVSRFRWQYLFICFYSEISNTNGYTTHSQGYWTTENMRMYLTNLARSFNLDPLLADTWYNFPARSLYQSKVLYFFPLVFSLHILPPPL